jgi:hypothetical protein
MLNPPNNIGILVTNGSRGLQQWWLVVPSHGVRCVVKRLECILRSHVKVLKASRTDQWGLTLEAKLLASVTSIFLLSMRSVFLELRYLKT